jgi:hypothetical protein
MYNISQKYFLQLVFFAKILIIAGAYYIISTKILDHGVFNNELLIEEFSSFRLTDYSFLLFLLIFSLSNWILEIFKWKSLVKFIRPISFSKAADQSLSSLTASLITPNRIGEYGAKAIYFEKSERSKIMLLNFLGNFLQMAVTLIFGCLGLLILWENQPPIMINSAAFLGFTTIVILLVTLGFLFKRKWKVLYSNVKNQFLKIPYAIHKKTLLYSILRYLVFSHQFYLFLIFFGVDLQYALAMPIIFSMYFIASVIPGFVIFDWLVKGSVAVALFGYFGVNEIIVLSITGLMWIFNFAVPSLIGMFFVLTFDGSRLRLKQTEVVK